MSFHHERRVTTRKPHRCAGCLAGIEIGANVTYVSGTTDDGFYASYLCDPCNEFLDTHPHYFDDDFWYEGDIGEARREVMP